VRLLLLLPNPPATPLPPILLPHPFNLIHLSSSFIILLRRRCSPRRAPFFTTLSHDALTLLHLFGETRVFLKMILADRARHLFRILPYLVHCTSQEQKVT